MRAEVREGKQEKNEKKNRKSTWQESSDVVELKNAPEIDESRQRAENGSWKLNNVKETKLFEVNQALI